MLSKKPGSEPAHARIPRKVLKSAFWPMMQRLDIVPSDAELPGVVPLFELVLDQDRLLKGTAASTRVGRNGHREFVYKTDRSEDADEVKKRVRDFIVCLTKIELWLLGFDLEINGTADYKVVKFGLQRDIGRNTEIREALDEFYRKLPKRGRLSKREFRRDITPELLMVLDEPRPVGPKASRKAAHQDYSFEVSNRVQKPEEIEEAWREGKALGARLWDGLKRVWRWIRRGAKKILDIGRNRFRAFFRYALKAFEIARFASRTIAAAVSQFVDGEIRTGENNPVRVLLAGDGDIHATVPGDAPPERVSHAVRRVRYFSKAFYFTTRIFAALMRVVKSTVLAVLGNAFKWIRLLWVLVRSYREIRPLYRELRDQYSTLDDAPLFAA